MCTAAMDESLNSEVDWQLWRNLDWITVLSRDVAALLSSTRDTASWLIGLLDL